MAMGSDCILITTILGIIAAFGGKQISQKKISIKNISLVCVLIIFRGLVDSLVKDY